MTDLLDRMAEALRAVFETYDREDWPNWYAEASAMLAEYDALKVRQLGTTHYEGCWRDPKHHECAVSRIEEAHALLESVLGAQEPKA